MAAGASPNMPRRVRMVYCYLKSSTCAHWLCKINNVAIAGEAVHLATKFTPACPIRGPCFSSSLRWAGRSWFRRTCRTIVRPIIVCFALFAAWQSLRIWYLVVRVITIAVGIRCSSHLLDPSVLRFPSRSTIQVCWGYMVPIITLCFLLDQIARTKNGQSFSIRRLDMQITRRRDLHSGNGSG